MVDLVRKVGAEFLVNTQTAGLQFFQTIDALPGGGFVAAWLDQVRGIRAQRFDAMGAKVGGEIVVSSESYQVGSVSALASGGFVVAWPDHSDILKARIFDLSGNPLGSAFPVSTSAAQVDVFELQSGGFVFTWWDKSSSANGNNVKAQVFDAAGTKVGGEILVNSATPGVQNEPSGVAIGGGNFVIVWTDQQGSGGDPDLSVKGQIYNGQGIPIGGNFLINTTIYSSQSTPDVAALPNGGFVVAWRSFDGTYQAKVQIYDAAGNKVGPELLASTPGDDVSICSVTALPWGGFLVAWDNFAPSGSARYSSHAQLFDQYGNVLGPQFQINSAPTFANSGIELTTLASGEVAAVWTNEEGGAGERVGVKGQILSMPIVGTSSGDVLNGGASAETFAGLGGNDEIHGGGGADGIEGNSGDDLLDGEAGDDLLEGGAGNDVLLGGTGADSMAGGTGNDEYEVDNVNDTVFERAGEGTADKVYAYVDYTLPTNVENLIMTYGIQRFGTGNEGDNIIFGNAQGNAIQGGAGYDTLTGGAGSDLFVVNPNFGVDVITDFVAGAGTEDAILFSTALFTSFSQVIANAAQVGADTWIGDGQGNTVVLAGVLIGNLHPDDFGFV